MPTIIALDVSLSMIRLIPQQPGNTDTIPITWHTLAVKGINQFLDYLTDHSKLEYVSLIIYSTLYEIIVDFTREYDEIRQALNKIEHYDKTCLENVLQAVNNILLTNWGTQNYSQVLVFTDCGIGFGSTSLKNTIANLRLKTKNDYTWIPFSNNASKLSFICLGNTIQDVYFKNATKLYQELLDVSGQKGNLFIPKFDENQDSKSVTDQQDKQQQQQQQQQQLNQQIDQKHLIKSFDETIELMCETNFKQFEAILKCGGYFKLESPVIIWPSPIPYVNKATETTKLISRKLEICGFINLADIGSPMSISRHLLLPKIDPIQYRSNVKNDENSNSSTTSSSGPTGGGGGGAGVVPSNNSNSTSVVNEFEKLENDIKTFYAKTENIIEIDDETGSVAGGSGVGGGNVYHTSINDLTKESVCVLLHGALKVENSAALVLLNDDWFGFIYSYADSKKKSNLMLTILPPGHDGIPWLGDLRYLGYIEDAVPNENPSFPVKPEKRSYSQNCVVWIKQSGLQSDIQKVLRHARKLPEKTQHFYKELNRIRRAALSLGFVELLDGLSSLFEREISVLAPNTSPDAALQLKHSALELRKINNRDLKTIIMALPTKYNQLL